MRYRNKDYYLIRSAADNNPLCILHMETTGDMAATDLSRSVMFFTADRMYNNGNNC